ncbi:tripartite tricarboxylate transporter TctB family protein [Vannielia litorea]|uniref:tripartite tricarboxylate transporter TctB family protein n=2 Tax=Vannielia litorea TaxID=1217970 RepID=UPI001C98071C|nr:tripartite tricarboxylate transporter TctB family protein [Vannielia litorea]MBY6048993.1 tripartite tricarboxylate transporter TctB family protein [Vannielia litorea]
MMNTEKPLGAGLIAFGAAGIWATLQISVRTFNDDPGPQLFPILGFSLLVLCGLGMLLTRARQSKVLTEAEADAVQEARSSTLRGVVMAGLLVAYSLALWIFGYYIATPLMVYAFYHTIAGPERRVWWRGALYAAAVTLGVHLVFAEMLNTLLPTGLLF